MAAKTNIAERVPLNLNDEMKKMKISRSAPLKRISKIVSNYTRRNQPKKKFLAKYIPQKGTLTRLSNYNSLEDISDMNHTQSPTDEYLLNSMRLSPPKAEISMTFDKSMIQDDPVVLKSQLNAEKVRYNVLQQSYRELLETLTQNETYYKEKIAQLQSRLDYYENSTFVTKAEFVRLMDKVSGMEIALMNKSE